MIQTVKVRYSLYRSNSVDPDLNITLVFFLVNRLSFFELIQVRPGSQEERLGIAAGWMFRPRDQTKSQRRRDKRQNLNSRTFASDTKLRAIDKFYRN